MGEERVLEVPRRVAPALAKLLSGLVLLVLGGAIALAAPSLAVKIGFASMAGAFALVMMIGGLQVVTGRPLWLRATPAGLWFGGGPIIAWSEISTMYCPRDQHHPIGVTVKPTAISIAFRSKRTVFRLPMSCWLTSLTPGDIQIPTMLYHDGAHVLLARLEAMRTTVCADEDGVIPTDPPPAARVVRR